MRSMLENARGVWRWQGNYFGAAMVLSCVVVAGVTAAPASAAAAAKPAQAASKGHHAEHAAAKVMKEAKGSVVRVDHAGKFIVVKTAAGAEETFSLGKDVTIDSAKGVEHGGAAVVKGATAGADVTVHYTEEGAKKVAHALKHG